MRVPDPDLMMCVMCRPRWVAAAARPEEMMLLIR